MLGEVWESVLGCDVGKVWENMLGYGGGRKRCGGCGKVLGKV